MYGTALTPAGAITRIKVAIIDPVVNTTADDRQNAFDSKGLSEYRRLKSETYAPHASSQFRSTVRLRLPNV